MNLYNSVYGINATTIVKSGAGFVQGISVTTAGSTAGGIYDASTVSGAVALGPLAFAIPAVTGMFVGIPTPPGWYCQFGITVVPGSGQVLNITYN
jgi:hypothetical protein